MSKTNRGAVLLVLVAVLIAMGGISLLKGGFFIGKHEGDTIHLVDIVMRMSMGQKPHSDFMTPIGFLAFAPMSMFVACGSGIGHAIIQSQIFVAIALLPAIWWVSVSRLPKRLAMGLGVVVLVMILALVHGEANSAVSISMHYNRWAWALAYLAIMGSILPPIYGQSRIADGAIIGGAMAALVLIKVTYFVAFALPVVLALIVTRQIMTFVYAVIAGLFVAGAVTAFYGVDFWFAYLADLQAVASSETRAAPGLPLDQILIAPAYMGITAMGVAGVTLLRQAGAKAGGLVLLTLLPGFVYVTYQNYGNDPQWLLLFAILVLALRPETDRRAPSGLELRGALGILAVIALTFGAPSFLNMAYSPFRHNAVDTTDYIPMFFETEGALSDLYAFAPRIVQVTEKRGLDGAGEYFHEWNELADRGEPTEFMGMTFDDCTLDGGMAAYSESIGAELTAVNGQPVFVADIFNALWLYQDFAPVTGAAPWNYGDLSGFENASHLLVPTCPMSAQVHGAILDAITDAEASLTEIDRTEMYILYEIG